MSNSKKRKKKSKPSENCPHCKSGSETYRCKYFGKRYKFDITLARKLVLDGREPVEVEEDCLRTELEETRIYREHLPHVQTKYPGIIGHVWFPMPDGELAQGHLLMDGNHRAARCLMLGIPYFAHVLTEQESYEIMLEGPNLDHLFGNEDSRKEEPVLC